MTGWSLAGRATAALTASSLLAAAATALAMRWLPPLPAAQAVSDDAAHLDRGALEQALERAHGVIAQAARELGLSRQALYRRMEKLGLREP